MKKFCIIGLFLGLAACSAKVDSGASDLIPAPPAPQATEVKPTLACSMTEAANGKLTKALWKFKSGVAFASGFAGMWDVTLYDTLVQNPCHTFGPGKGISLRIPQTVGDFKMENSAETVFYDLNQSPNVSLYTSNGQGRVDVITADSIQGSFEAYVDENTGACGQFTITRCQ